VLIANDLVLNWREFELRTDFRVGEFEVVRVILADLLCLFVILVLPFFNILAFATELGCHRGNSELR